MTEFKTRTLSTAEAEAEGFAIFNDCPHFCVDLPDGISTVSFRTSAGKRVTASFLPYKNGQAADCVDVCAHDGEMLRNRDRDMPRQTMLAFRQGGIAFDSREEGVPPILFATLIFEQKKN